jgi:cell shape-determining protein MreC
MNRPATWLCASAASLLWTSSMAGEASEHTVASGSDVVAPATLQALVGRLVGQWQIVEEAERYVALISDSFNYVPIDAVCSRLRVVISLGDAVDPAENLFPLRQDQIFALKAEGDDGCNEVLLDDYFERPGTREPGHP